MVIRMLTEDELKLASGLATYVFDTCLRNRMEFTQTIGFVENYISEANLKVMHRENKLVVFGAFEQEQLVGVAGLQSNGLITLLYVLPQYNGRNCGMHLLNVMRDYAQIVLRLDKVMVNATPAWTASYFEKNGFSVVNSEQNMDAPFVTMQALSKNKEFKKKEKISGKTIVGAVFTCLGFATIASGCFLMYYLLR